MDRIVKIIAVAILMALAAAGANDGDRVDSEPVVTHEAVVTAVSTPLTVGVNQPVNEPALQQHAQPTYTPPPLPTPEPTVGAYPPPPTIEPTAYP